MRATAAFCPCARVKDLVSQLHADRYWVVGHYEGISVDWVRLGAEAVARIAARRPDAVIFDLGLPDVDGLTLYDEVASRWPDLPVLFSTGHGDENLLTNSPTGKKIGYLQKPYESDVLLAALDELMR